MRYIAMMGAGICSCSGWRWPRSRVNVRSPAGLRPQNQHADAFQVTEALETAVDTLLGPVLLRDVPALMLTVELSFAAEHHALAAVADRLAWRNGT